MTQKLEIIDPYTPEHEGPFCTENLRPVEIKIRDGRGVFPVKGYISDETELTEWTDNGVCLGMGKKTNLMNAREVPVAREFWVNEYAEMSGEGFWFNVFSDKSTAKRSKTDTYIRTIHVREVLPGEDE